MSPNQDLQRKNAGHTRHVRLISEGGASSLASTHPPLCIDSIHVNQTCITESHHQACRSTTGACSMFSLPDTSLFSVPSEQALQLDQGLLPALLRSRFQQQGIPLSDGARVELQQIGRIWLIKDQGRNYPVRKFAASLTVYRDSK